MKSSTNTQRRGRLLKLAAISAVTTLGLAACGGGGSSDKSDAAESDDQTPAASASGDCDMASTIDLMVPSYSDLTKQSWETVIKGFEAEYPETKVNLEMQSWENINDVVRTKIQSDQMPDILNIDAFAGFVDDDMLYPVEEVMSPDTIADLQDSFVQNASMDGTQYGIPLIASTRVLFYNKDLFKEAGLDPDKPPTTWDELRTDAEKISAIGGDVYGYGLPLGNEEAQGETAVWIFGNGGGYGDQDELTINSPENVEALEFVQALTQDGLTQPDAGSSQRTPLGDVFIQGKIGMIVGLTQTVGQIEERNPDMDYGITAIPSKNGEPVTLGVADHLMAFDNGDDSKQCAIREFLDYFYQPEVYTGWVDAEGFIPVTKSGGELMADKEELVPFIAVLPDAKFYPSTNPNWAAATGAIQSLVGQVAQGKDVSGVLDDIQQKAQ